MHILGSKRMSVFIRSSEQVAYQSEDKVRAVLIVKQTRHNLPLLWPLMYVHTSGIAERTLSLICDLEHILSQRPPVKVIAHRTKQRYFRLYFLIFDSSIWFIINLILGQHTSCTALDHD